MDRKLTGGRHCNGGFSLIETIVTVLITSMVMLTIVGFLSISLNSYRSVSDDTSLQLEAQIAMDSVSELLQESKEWSFCRNMAVGSGTYSALCVKLAEKTSNVGDYEDYYYIVLHDSTSDMLLLGKVRYGTEAGEARYITAEGFPRKLSGKETEASGDEAAFMKSLVTGTGLLKADGTANNRRMLAKGITDFSVSKANDVIINISLVLMERAEELVSSSTVTLRNR